MKTQGLLEEIQQAAQTIQSHAGYIEELNGDVENTDELGDGEGEYEMLVTLSITSHERGREQAEQHCRKVAGSLRNDSAVGRFDIADTRVQKIRGEAEEE